MSGRQVGRRSAAVGSLAALLLGATAAGAANAEGMDGKLARRCEGM